MKRVRCLKCGAFVGDDSAVRMIECCLVCHAGKKNKKKEIKQTAASVFARTTKGPASDLPGKYCSINMRSGWERNFARILCAQGKKWEYERTSFPFTISPITGKEYKTRPFIYIPDFHDLETGILWEIKGMLRSQDRSKMMRFKSCYPEDFNRLKVCLSKNNKNAISFYSSIGVEMKFIEDLRDQWKEKIPAWEGK